MKTLTFLRAAGSDLTASQPKAILKCLEKFDPSIPVTFETLGKALDEDPAFISRQKAELVVAFYAKRLADKGYVRYDIIVEEPARPPTVEPPTIETAFTIEPIGEPTVEAAPTVESAPTVEPIVEPETPVEPAPTVEPTEEAIPLPALPKRKAKKAKA
jgi:hypothetical protein